MVTVNNYYNNIPVGRDLNNLPNTSSAGTTVGYQYDGLTEEDRFVQKVLQEHYDKVYKENLSHSDPMAYIESKYCDVTSPNFCSYMTEDQRSIAYRNEKRMLQTGGKYSAGFARYDYALRNYKDVYTGASRSTGYIRNTDKEKQYARSVVNQQISNLFSKNGISLSKQADLTFSIDPYTYQLTVSGNADRDTLSQIEKLLNEGDNAKNIWTHAWICMHDSDNELLIRKQIGQRRTNILYGMKCMRQQGMMHAMRHIEMVLLLQRMAQIYLPCLRQRLKMAQGMNFILIDSWNMLRMAGKKKMI